MIIKAIGINEPNAWNKIVKSFINYDVYYLAGYAIPFQLHGDGEPLLLYFENETTKAMNVVMKRDIANERHLLNKLEKNTYFDLSTPYGYGGFIIEGNDVEALDKAYSCYCRENNIISEFVRYHPVICNQKLAASMYDVSEICRTVTMDLKSTEQIWNDLSTKNRNVIRKAKKSGVEIYWGQARPLLDEFVLLYNKVMDRVHAEDYYYFKNEFYDSLFTYLKNNSLMFYSVFKGKIIAMSIIIFANHQMHYHLSASDKEYRHLAPTNLLLYEAACWGCENGYTSLHLGGGVGGHEDNLYKFKEAFNKNSRTYFSVGLKIFDINMYRELVDMRSNEGDWDTETRFFPAYRN